MGEKSKVEKSETGWLWIKSKERKLRSGDKHLPQGNEHFTANPCLLSSSQRDLCVWHYRIQNSMETVLASLFTEWLGLTASVVWMTNIYYPGQKKEPFSRFVARRPLFHVWYHAPRAISAGQKSQILDLAMRWSFVNKHYHKIEQRSSRRESWVWFFFFVQGSSWPSCLGTVSTTNNY